MKDAFGSSIAVGDLVTYAMKAPGGGGTLYPLARIAREGKCEGWVDVELDEEWVKQHNTPLEERLAAKENRHPMSQEAIESQLLKKRTRNVATMSLIYLGSHPAFSRQEFIRKHGCECVGLSHHPDCPKHVMCL